MEVLIETTGDLAVAAMPVDELDAGNVPDFKREIGPVLEAHRRVVLDLSRLRFIDSSGLGAILSCLRQLSAKGGDLKLCGLSSQVRAALELVRMHRIFDIHATKEEALRAFVSHPAGTLP